MDSIQIIVGNYGQPSSLKSARGCVVEVSSPALLGTARRRLQEPAFLEACTPEDSARLVAALDQGPHSGPDYADAPLPIASGAARAALMPPPL